MSVLIIGAGPAGIAAALTLIDEGYTGEIRLVELGRDLPSRLCPVDRGHACAGCGGTCNVLSGLGGCIHYGDAVKLSLLPAGKRLRDTLGRTADSRFASSVALIERDWRLRLHLLNPRTSSRTHKVILFFGHILCACSPLTWFGDS